MVAVLGVGGMSTGGRKRWRDCENGALSASTLRMSLVQMPSPVARLAMEPIMVSSPVRMTTPQPSPVMTRELMKARLRASLGASS